MENKKPSKLKLLILSCASLVTIIALIFVLTNEKRVNSVNFSSLNNNNFGNKSKYDYMKKNKSFQPGDKKKHLPSVLKWSY